MSQSNFYNLSICIPTYNRSSDLANVIEKFIPIIKNENIEIVISDNNSSDNTTDVLAPFLDKYSFIKYYKNDFNMKKFHIMEIETCKNLPKQYYS